MILPGSSTGRSFTLVTFTRPRIELTIAVVTNGRHGRPLRRQSGPSSGALQISVAVSRGQAKPVQVYSIMGAMTELAT
jgi:hypothetical protein